jgi:phage-related protein
MTTGQSLKILATTNLLKIDNREKPFIITDESISIKDSKRGEYIYLAPGENNIVISLENFVDFESVNVKITFNSVFE